MAHPGDRERWTDAQLIEAVAARDGDAFRVLYRRYVRQLLAFLLRQTGDAELAADLAAEVFAAALIAAGRYEPRHETAVPWLYGIARNVLGASRRRGRVDDRARRRLGFEPLELDALDLERIHAHADEEHAPVVALAEALPAAEREAVYARVVQERAYSEIAGELQCSEFVVRQRVSRGLARLRAQFKERQ